MLNRLKRFVREWRAMRAYKALPMAQREVVFYSEGPGYWVHLEATARHLCEAGQPIVYLTSAENDPLLDKPLANMRSYCIGEGTVRTIVFAGLEASLMVMTTPDLQTFHLKRSPHPVHYVYIHHSLVSCHMIYRPAAFDHFDSVFCCGPHHIEEIRARERTAGLKAKKLIEHGYGRLEELMKDAQRRPAKGTEPAHILVAPSWGNNGLIERHGDACIVPLLAKGYQVTLRPHPQTRRFQSAKLDQIYEAHKNNPRFKLEENVAGRESLCRADLMVSDWSGAAFEYALAFCRPVLFVDVPRKVNNPDYAVIGIEPVEARLRSEMGELLPESRLADIGEAAERLLGRHREFEESLRSLRDRLVFNVGSSGRVGAEALKQLL